MERVNYIWLDFTHYQANGKKSSVDSHLVYNGDLSLNRAKSMIDSIKLDYCREWIFKRSNFFSQKGIEVTLVAQDLSTGHVLYRRTVGIFS